MKISRLFELKKSQAELDFIDIDADRDTPLYLDPHLLGCGPDQFSIRSHVTIESFFSFFLELVRANREDDARALFRHLHEPNETCLGQSKGPPRGRGVGEIQAENIFQSIITSRAIETGVLEHLEDCRIYIPGVDKDKVSDMTTNIIRGSLISYTQDQCELHDIAMRPNTSSGPCWVPESRAWEVGHCDMLVINGRPILLVPKMIASFAKVYAVGKYHQHFVLDFVKAEQLRTNGPFVHRRQLQQGGERVWVVKKELAAGPAPLDKQFLAGFTAQHNQVFRDFREWAKLLTKPLNNDEIDTGEDVTAISTYLKEQLIQTATGNDAAHTYHRLIVGILELIFYPSLTCPVKEFEIDQGRKRIDIKFTNAARSGEFFRVHNVRQLPAQFIFVECKNYGNEVGNPEVDQLAGRLGVNIGKVGLLVCRALQDFPLLMRRCQDTYANGRGLIIPILDVDLVALLNAKIEDPLSRPEEDFLRIRIDSIVAGQY